MAGHRRPQQRPAARRCGDGPGRGGLGTGVHAAGPPAAGRRRLPADDAARRRPVAADRPVGAGARRGAVEARTHPGRPRRVRQVAALRHAGGGGAAAVRP
ncbi:Adenosylhomocysteinase [Actinacidiphila bryophytorum]|uniref:Adenosylhomocysteinase n=1 Tax=Actinacidiphila bryophytorum TaxID=1436133 RepID=A0A9W4GVZ5_9ACTN|nr:Adenosylhomocysteinase [Actinacidiphila bryophytorum]